MSRSSRQRATPRSADRARLRETTAEMPWLGADPVDIAAAAGIPLDVGRITGQRRRREDRWSRLLKAGVNGSRPRAAVVRRKISVRLLVTADLVAALCSLALLGALAAQTLHLPALLVLPGLVLLAKVTGLYDRDDVVLEQSTLDEAPQLFQLATLTALMAWVAQSLIADYPLRPSTIVVAWFGLFLLLVVARSTARRLTRRLAPRERMLFIGEEPTYRHLERRLVADRRFGPEFVGWVPLHGPVQRESLGDLANLPEIIGEHEVHRVVISASHGSEEMIQVIRLMKMLDVRVSLLPRMLEVVGTSLEFENPHGVAMMGVRAFGLSRSSEFVKRAMDIAGAGIGLLAMAPLFAVVALVVKLDSRGPVFYRQPRVGRRGEVFGMVKFRSMVPDADQRKDQLADLNEADGLFKIADDPRITRAGRWMRRTSIDELPQLVNVLRGDMSLVGPRPLVLDEDTQVEGWHRQRLLLTPGMTGPWQVLGGSRIPLREMIALDYLYVANWSLWNDVKILLRTVPVVLGARGQ